MSENQDQGSTHESLVQELVGDGRKYANLEELAKSRVAADQHIEKLESEMKELRDSVGQQHTIKDLMDAFKKTQKPTESESVTPLDDEGLQQKITEMLESREADRTRNANRADAKKRVLDVLDGNEELVDDFIKSKAQALGLSVDSLWSLSEESPTGFANLVGLGDRANPNTGSPASLPHTGGDALRQSGPMLEIDGHKTKAYYDAQRRELGNKKFLNDKSMQLGMIRAREALGEKFYQ